MIYQEHSDLFDLITGKENICKPSSDTLDRSFVTHLDERLFVFIFEQCHHEEYNIINYLL